MVTTERVVHNAEQRLAHNLKRLITEGQTLNYLVVSVGDVYVQLAGSRGEHSLYWEAVSNEFLPEELQLRQEAISQLKELGFQEPGPGRFNFHRTCDVSDEEALAEVAQEILSVLSGVYRCPAGSEIELDLCLWE